MALIQFKRGTQAELDTAATAVELNVGEPYYVTDVGYVAIGVTTSTYVPAPMSLLVVLESTDSDPGAGAYPDGTLIFKKL